MRENKQRGCTKTNHHGESSDDPTTTKKELEEKGKMAVPHDDPNSVYVGLRVYTHNDVPAVVVGRLKAKPEEEAKPESSSSSSSTCIAAKSS